MNLAVVNLAVMDCPVRRWAIWAAALTSLTALLPVGPVANADIAGRSEHGVTVVTDAGPVRGEVADGYYRFQGIPYAAPPMGELPWRSPAPVTPWTEPWDATQPGSPCSQRPDPLTGGDAGSEDCLFLNVTVPGDLQPDSRKPVSTRWPLLGPTTPLDRFILAESGTLGAASIGMIG
jgi:hypothetical protein